MMYMNVFILAIAYRYCQYIKQELFRITTVLKINTSLSSNDWKAFTLKHKEISKK